MATPQQRAILRIGNVRVVALAAIASTGTNALLFASAHASRLGIDVLKNVGVAMPVRLQCRSILWFGTLETIILVGAAAAALWENRGMTVGNIDDMRYSSRRRTKSSNDADFWSVLNWVREYLGFIVHVLVLGAVVFRFLQWNTAGVPPVGLVSSRCGFLRPANIDPLAPGEHSLAANYDFGVADLAIFAVSMGVISIVRALYRADVPLNRTAMLVGARVGSDSVPLNGSELLPIRRGGGVQRKARAIDMLV